MANTDLARRLCRLAVTKGHSPFAAHLLYPQFLDDSKDEEREAGIRCALDFLPLCDEVWVPDVEPSEGMLQELRAASLYGVTVREIGAADGL